MLYLLLGLLSLSISAQEQVRRPCPDHMRLEAIIGDDEITLTMGDEEIILDAPPGMIYSEDGPPMLFSTDPDRKNVLTVPRVDAVPIRGTNQFWLIYVTSEENGRCLIDAVTEEEI